MSLNGDSQAVRLYVGDFWALKKMMVIWDCLSPSFSRFMISVLAVIARHAAFIRKNIRGKTIKKEHPNSGAGCHRLVGSVHWPRPSVWELDPCLTG
jgi:hypothetical protein